MSYLLKRLYLVSICFLTLITFFYFWFCLFFFFFLLPFYFFSIFWKLISFFPSFHAILFLSPTHLLSLGAFIFLSLSLTFVFFSISPHAIFYFILIYSFSSATSAFSLHPLTLFILFFYLDTYCSVGMNRFTFCLSDWQYGDVVISQSRGTISLGHFLFLFFIFLCSILH